MIRVAPHLLWIRGEDVGVAYGAENWQRAERFLCDRLGRVETTPPSAFAPYFGASSGHHETNPGAALSADRDVRDHHGNPFAETDRQSYGETNVLGTEQL